jgi:hypothetical protein
MSDHCAGADDGMTVLFHVERPWPAAAQHGRSSDGPVTEATELYSSDGPLV